MYPKQQASGFYGAEIGNVAGVGNQGGADQISQRVYGPIEKGMHNRPKYGRLTTPDVYMAPYPYTPPGEPQELFPLGGNSRTGFRFEAGLPSRGEMLLAQSPSGGFQNIGNVGGMLGEGPGDMTEFARLLESMQEQNVQNSQREKDTRYGRSLGGY